MLGAFHPGVIDAGTDIVNRLALGELEGKGKEQTDETLLDNLLGGEARLMLRHLTTTFASSVAVWHSPIWER